MREAKKGREERKVPYLSHHLFSPNTCVLNVTCVELSVCARRLCCLSASLGLCVYVCSDVVDLHTLLAPHTGTQSVCARVKMEVCMQFFANALRNCIGSEMHVRTWVRVGCLLM